MKTRVLLTVLALSLSLAPAWTATEEKAQSDDAAALARTIQNPLATLITLPLQANYNRGFGPDNRMQYDLNVQPVIPFPGEKWNVISRTIIPVESVPQGQTASTFGLGDTTFSLFWSPAKDSKLIWGMGPIFGLPTATNPDILGTGRWGVGPTGVIFYSLGKWTMGGVASNLWSITGDNDRDHYNIFTAQYFVNYNFGGGWAAGTAPIVTANWKADSGDRWTIPWGVQVSKLTRIGSRPVNLLLGYYVNSDHPDGGADAQVRVQINLLFPSKKPGA